MSPLEAGSYAVLGHGSSVLNMAGHCAGALVFGIFLFLLTRDRAGSRLRGTGLTFAAAGLAFAWNLGALLLIALFPVHSLLGSIVELLSFGSLSLLAPVLLHISLNHRCPLAVAGYVVGAVAAGLHLAEFVLNRPELHTYALSLMAVGLGGITLASAVHLIGSRSSDQQNVLRRALGTGLLFIFVGTYVHLGQEHAARTWPTELLLHHASVPLALLIILHNHRFVLLDALIRFCANVVLAVLFTFACIKLIGVANPGFLALGICLLLLLFALARERLQKLMTRIVFGRGDAAAVSQQLRSGTADLKEEPAYLDWSLDRIATFMHSERVRVIPEELEGRLRFSPIPAPALSSDLPELRRPLEELAVEVIVPLRFSSTEAAFLLLGRRRGGQPYLSEDLKQLGQFSSIVADQVQAFREAELRRLATRAELRALQAQINPHFLFNALNTLYGLVPREATQARQTVLDLADIFRYFLRNEDTTIPLEDELRIVEAYLQIETLRLGGKLRKEIHVDPEALRIRIPILSIQPLVENAVKHGIAPQTSGGVVRLEVRLSGGGLDILVGDTGAGMTAGRLNSTGGAGVGLQNVARRLKLSYGPEAELRIGGGPEGTTVGFTVPVEQAAGLVR
jgi:hypothetical protein